MELMFTFYCTSADGALYLYNFWPGLGLPRPKAIVVIPKNQPLPKHLRKKREKVRSTPATTLQKKRPVKIIMYLGLDIIIKINFTTILIDVQY